MKRIIRGLSLIIIITLSLLFINPIKTDALGKQTLYANVNDVQSLTVDTLTFSNITFKDNSTSSTQAIGLTGTLNNSTKGNVYYFYTVSYFDIDYRLIGSSTHAAIATVGSNQFDFMSNLTILNGHNVSDIVYYNLEIDVTGNDQHSSFTPSKSSEYGYLDYVIDAYDINIVVNENNTLDITENITAYFNISKHGIFRTIPLKNEIVRLDGTVSKKRAQVSNLDVDNQYSVSRENGNYMIQIGNPNRTLTGKQTYVIKYTYNLGKDPMKGYDELYYNLIGTEWDTVIGNITFTITMPKDFDSSKLGFSSGLKGSTENSKVVYSVSGNKITGQYNGILGANEALTVRCELEEGYFVGAGLPIYKSAFVSLILPIIFLIISSLIWYKYGRDDQVIETVEFYPPKGFNSLEVGYLYKGKADSEDVTSLLIYLANEGYIKIVETEEKSLFSTSKGFKIIKLKEYDGNNINEHVFLNGLFRGRKSYSSLFSKDDKPKEEILDEVTSFDLYDSFYVTMNKILANINSKENKDKIFEKIASNKFVSIVIMIIITFFVITLPPLIIYGDSEVLVPAVLFPGIGFSFLFSMLIGGKQTIYVNGKATNSLLITKLFGLIWGGMFGGIPWFVMVLPAISQDPLFFLAYMVGIVCVMGMIVCLKYLPKRTPYGNEMLGKIKGFRNFLETAEKDRLESMVMQNPTYFYDILPYTYVLGVSDTWIKKFETITLQAPRWYDGPDIFDMVAFEKFMNTTMVSAQSAMSSSPSSSSSGGGSSGGGSSGGGSGGGGGGSW